MAEPTAVMVKRWECPFCHRRRARKNATTEHMARCWFNPAVRSCRTCANLDLYRGAGVPDPCIPGQPCHCDDDEVTCEAGVPLDFGTLPITGCPAWMPLPREDNGDG